jgi:hypothetical protein
MLPICHLLYVDKDILALKKACGNLPLAFDLLGFKAHIVVVFCLLLRIMGFFSQQSMWLFTTCFELYQI